MPDWVKCFAPATVANVGCAFDVLGFAVETPGDNVLARLCDAPGVRITNIQPKSFKLPGDSQRNSAGAAVLALLAAFDEQIGIELEIEKLMPVGSGMGSSAASSAAAVFATNLLLNCPFSLEELVPFAMEGERAACGAAHADNVAPALLGGLVLLRDSKPLDLVKLSSPRQLFCALVKPELEVKTSDARKLLPERIELQRAVHQWGSIAGLVLGLERSDPELIARSLPDTLIEPLRARLIPGFDEAKKAALNSGALACSISGSGPSLFALSFDEGVTHCAAEAMITGFASSNLKSTSYVSRISDTGARELGRG